MGVPTETLSSFKARAMSVANPKSASFHYPLLDFRIFPGLISLCTTPILTKYLIAAQRSVIIFIFSVKESIYLIFFSRDPPSQSSMII